MSYSDIALHVIANEDCRQNAVNMVREVFDLKGVPWSNERTDRIRNDLIRDGYYATRNQFYWKNPISWILGS